MIYEDIISKIQVWCDEAPVFGIQFPNIIETGRPGDTAYELQSVSITSEQLIRLVLVYPHSKSMVERGIMKEILGITVDFSDAQDIVDGITERIDCLGRTTTFRRLQLINCHNLMVNDLVPGSNLVRGHIYVDGSIFYEQASLLFDTVKIGDHP